VSVLWAVLLAVVVGAVTYRAALAAKAHLGAQREPVAFVLALTAGVVALAIPLLVAVVDGSRS
jgi:ABC-type uncharacterized transport system permease subunit